MTRATPTLLVVGICLLALALIATLVSAVAYHHYTTLKDAGGSLLSMFDTLAAKERAIESAVAATVLFIAGAVVTLLGRRAREK